MIRWILWPVLVFIVTVLAISLFLAPDSLLRCGDTPSEVEGCNKADAIIAVSGGDTEARTQEAIDLFQRGWGNVLIFSGAALDKSGPSNAEVMREQALEQGVSPGVIRIEEQSETTAENASKTKDILLDENIASAILVTSSYHAKRTQLEFRQRAASVDFRVRPVSADSQWSVYWWATPYGWYLALSELVKILVFYAGGSR